MSSQRIVKLGLVQMKCIANRDANIEKAISGVREAAKQGANIVSLQEVFSGPYPCQSEDHCNFDWAESIPGDSANALSKIAKELGVVVAGSIFERRAAGLYHNAGVIYDADGSQAGFYRKMHIPDDPLFYEKFYFTPGDTGFTIANTKFGKIGQGVCWDQWYPEAARLFALAGAEILLYPTAIGWSQADKPTYGAAQHSAWETMMRSHAIANGIYVGAANRVGVEAELEFWGASFVSDPSGNVLHRASQTDEEIFVVDCNLDLINETRTHWPFLRDRRIDAYGDLTKRYID